MRDCSVNTSAEKPSKDFCSIELKLETKYILKNTFNGFVIIDVRSNEQEQINPCIK